MPLNFRTTNVLFGERMTLEGDDGNDIDLGHVGKVTRVDRTTIENLCYAGQVPVIPSMCMGDERPEAERQRRHRRHRGRHGAGGREADFFERRERRAPQKRRCQYADPFAHRRASPRPDSQTARSKAA